MTSKRTQPTNVGSSDQLGLMPERSCVTCGTLGCGHQGARRCGHSFDEWTPQQPRTAHVEAAMQQAGKYQTPDGCHDAFVRDDDGMPLDGSNPNPPECDPRA